MFKTISIVEGQRKSFNFYGKLTLYILTLSVPRSPTYLKCAGCEYPMCSTECATKRVRHTEAECEVLSRCPDSERPKILRVGADNTYSIITPLRMLLMSDTNCDSWKRSNQLMDHLDGTIDKKVFVD